MYKIFIVGIGGFFGASLRYIISGLSMRMLNSSFPYGTLCVNVLGSFFLGLIMEASLNTWNVSPNTRITVTTGFLGGLTTFSTFSYETASFLHAGSYLMGGLNITLNVAVCLFGLWLGKSFVHII